MDHREWLNVKIVEAADQARKLQYQGTFQGVYLYYKRGDLVAAYECPEGMELGENERIPENVDRDGLIAWISARARRLPCLPLEK